MSEAPCPNCGMSIPAGADWCPHCALRQKVVASQPKKVPVKEIDWNVGTIIIFLLMLAIGIPLACFGGCMILITGNFIEHVFVFAVLASYVVTVSLVVILVWKGFASWRSK